MCPLSYGLISSYRVLSDSIVVAIIVSGVRLLQTQEVAHAVELGIEFTFEKAVARWDGDVTHFVDEFTVLC